MKARGRVSGGFAASTRLAEAILKPVFTAMAVLAAIAGAMIVVLIGTSVAMRYFANAPFRFTEELVGLLMTAAFFLALPRVTLNAEHVRVQVVVAFLRPRARRVAAAVAGIFGAVFCVWFVALCLPWLGFAIDRQIKTEVARLLLFPWMALIPVSLLLTAAAFLIRGASGEKRVIRGTSANGDGS
ncbi:MAG: TRAP transporter small permease subunit [Albidovulum sp.]|nr:TRAP transporter small permease subunit [Albidovulum sp.]